MEGAEVPTRRRNIWSKQKYREEVGIYGLTRNTWREHKYRQEVGINGGSRNTGRK
jgi:hypothetical protein